MKKKTRANLILLTTAIIWGTAFVAQVSGGKELDPFSFNFFRNILAGLTLLGLMKLLRKNHPRPRKKDQKEARASLLGGLACGTILMLAMTFQQIGLSGPGASSAGKAGFITALYIILVPLLGLVRKKGPSLKIWACVLLAALGLYLLTIKEDLSIGIGDLMVLVSALFYSLHILVIDHFGQEASGLKMSMIQFLTAALLSGLVMTLRGLPGPDQIISSLVPILYAGFFSSALGYTFQIIAQKDTDPNLASLILSLESVFAVLAGGLILGERLTIRETLGSAIMFLAITLAQLAEKPAQEE